MRLLPLALLALLPGCAAVATGPDMPATPPPAVTPPPLDDGRPRFHFTPPAGWINDPNGLVYLDGEYHLFYQHHPVELIWAPMHWGHAVSRDLVHWEHLPIALEPDDHGMIFSGSAVVDRADTAGFGAGAMVAVFTHHRDDGRQVQSLAYSTDRGRSWTKYAGNPVLAPADAPVDFRDPRVFWYGGEHGGHWVMALAVGQEVWFYTSPDLKSWTKAGTFGADHGSHDGVWECPELVQLPVDGGPERRWALIVGVQRGAPAGGSGTQYFVGEFDGATFTSDDPPDTVRWADFGGDFYAAQAWHAVPGGRTLWLAWMNNWDYARDTPATDYRGMMTAPRELALARDADGVRLVQQPARELAAIRGSSHTLHDLTIAAGTTPLPEVNGRALEIVATFRADSATATRFGLRVRVGRDEATVVGYNRERAALYVDRSRSGMDLPGFAAPQVVALAPRDGRITLHLLVDTASLELFADDGRVTLTNQIFPRADSVGVELFAEGGEVELETLDAWALAPLP